MRKDGEVRTQVFQLDVYDQQEDSVLSSSCFLDAISAGGSFPITAAAKAAYLNCSESDKLSNVLHPSSFGTYALT